MTVSAEDFEFVRGLVRDESGLSLSDNQQYLVEARLGVMAARGGADSIADLLARARLNDVDARREITEAMANYETSFFRDVHPFNALRSYIIPELLESSPGGWLSLWSAGTGTGQEAYSLAMLMKEDFPDVRNVTIIGSDFSTQALDRARDGVYSQLEVNRGLPAQYLVKHFERWHTQWRISAELRRMVTFREINMIRPFPHLPMMDVVFLRNVLTYMDKDRRPEVLSRVAKILRPGGYLFVGGAESIYALEPSLHLMQVGGTVCYKRDGGDT